ncbi:uncharacterized protein KD926_003161 [Aspergillus affinis]|uniref:uncharacterized protein n=1 Tax=Aspergillus affinis TaxID=1070780 RepID=UPI0022FF0DDA|nr:uncharacterized protein KD926_003161 [Aspergillus affinis]KAI9035650.1 hypothetical protein KD926_003161 [Aspergillus affinis]
MHFKSSILAIIFSLFALTNAVTLNQFTRPRCGGQKAVCRNIGQRVCCEAASRVFASASCTGCTSTDFHITWNKVGRLFCGKSAAATHGGGCISGGSNLRGHSWCRLCGTSTSGVELQAATCTSTAEPDALEIGSKWFTVDRTVSEDDRNALWALWDSEADDASVPQKLLRYEIEAVTDDEIDVHVPGVNANEEPGKPQVVLPGPGCTEEHAEEL